MKMNLLKLNSITDFYFLIIARKKNIRTKVVIDAAVRSMRGNVARTGKKTSDASKNK
jgi:hypothetical protein